MVLVLCVYIRCCVLCVHVVCGFGVVCVCMWCCVLCGLCLCVRVVCEAWHAENPLCVRSKRLRVYGQDVSVCTGNGHAC